MLHFLKLTLSQVAQLNVSGYNYIHDTNHGM